MQGRREIASDVVVFSCDDFVCIDGLFEKVGEARRKQFHLILCKLRALRGGSRGASRLTEGPGLSGGVSGLSGGALAPKLLCARKLLKRGPCIKARKGPDAYMCASVPCAPPSRVNTMGLGAF